MGILQRIFGQTESRAASRDLSWELLRQSLPVDGSMPVSPAVAESLSAVYGAVRLLSEVISSLPCLVYRKTDNGREEAPNHPVARLLQGQASEHFTGPELVETVTASALLHGAGYAEIVRDGRGVPVELRPLGFGMVSPVRLPNNRIAFDVTDSSGGSTRRLLSSEVLALYDRREDPFQIRSRLSRTAATIQGAVAAERFAQAIFANGAALSGVLSHPQNLSKEAHARLRQSFEAMFAGPQSAGKVAILEEAMKWEAISSHPDQTQLLETRRYTVEQISRVYGVPSVLLGDTSKSAYGNVVELSRQLLQYGIAPWLTRWEKRIMWSLFSEAGRLQYECEFDSDLLLRADMLARLQAYNIGRQAGLYTSNDLRRFEKLPTRTDPGGDEFLAPLAMQPAQDRRPKDDPPSI